MHHWSLHYKQGPVAITRKIVHSQTNTMCMLPAQHGGQFMKLAQILSSLSLPLPRCPACSWLWASPASFRVGIKPGGHKPGTHLSKYSLQRTHKMDKEGNLQVENAASTSCTHPATTLHELKRNFYSVCDIQNLVLKQFYWSQCHCMQLDRLAPSGSPRVCEFHVPSAPLLEALPRTGKGGIFYWFPSLQCPAECWHGPGKA